MLELLDVNDKSRLEELEMKDKAKEITVENTGGKVDYNNKQFIDIRYKKKTGEMIALYAYNTDASTMVEAINLDDFDELKDLEIEEVQIIILGTYDHLTILCHENESYKITINCGFKKRGQAEINFFSITAGNQVDLSFGWFGFFDCIGMTKLLINSSEIDLVSLDRAENVVVSDCQVSRFIISHSKKLKKMWGKITNEVMVEHSSIDNFMLYDEVNKLVFDECDVKRYSQREVVCEYSEKYSSITPAYTLPINRFEVHNKDCCKLGLRAATVSDDLELYIKYNDILMDIERKRSPMWKRVSYWYLNRTIGYGFKPVRALWFSLGVIAVFAFIYLGIDVLMGNLILDKINGWEDMGDVVITMIKYVYQSGITYTTIGFSDILNFSPLVGLLYVFEALMGISVLSLFVFALTRKYFFGK